MEGRREREKKKEENELENKLSAVLMQNVYRIYQSREQNWGCMRRVELLN